MTTQITIGMRVQVARNSSLDKSRDRFVGRVGTVAAENGCGRGQSGGLWYVDLEPTARAKARTETFWGKELRWDKNA